MTKVMKSSQPALRLMGLEELFFRELAPSLRALTSSNMVSASEFWMSSVRARMAARGGDI